MKMSPEPSREPVDNNLNTSNLNINLGVVNDDSDSDNEEAGLDGYAPLSQNPIEGENLNDFEDEELEYETSEEPQENVALQNQNNVNPVVAPETIEVWSSSLNRSDIELDADKINQVKSAMASFTLPSSSIPEWASNVSEDQWKEQLIGRIKKMQTDINSQDSR